VKCKLKYHSSIALIVFIHAISFGQGTNIQGKISLLGMKNSDACIVQLLEKDGVGLVKFKYTDKDGSFQFLGLEDRDYKLNINQFGYQDTLINLSKEGPENYFLNVCLKPLCINLDEISIVDKVALLKKSGDTTTFNLKMLKKGNELTTSDIIRRIPGMDIQNSKVSYHGKTINRIFVDKIDLSDQNHTSLTNNIRFDDVKDINVVEHFNEYNSYTLDSTELGLAMLIELKDEAKNKPQISSDINTGYKSAYRISGSMISLSKRGGIHILPSFNNTPESIRKFDKGEYIKSVKKDILFSTRHNNVHQSEKGQSHFFENNNAYHRVERGVKVIASRNLASFTTLKSTNNIYLDDTKSELGIAREYFPGNASMNEKVLSNNNFLKISSNTELKTSLNKHGVLNIYFPVELVRRDGSFNRSLQFNSNLNSSQHIAVTNRQILNPHYNLDFKKNKFLFLPATT